MPSLLMGLDPKDWVRAREVFERALALPPGDRAAYVADSCAGHNELRSEVDKLVASHERAPSFLESPAVSLFPNSTAHMEGKRIGPYQLYARIGAGGMGEVYKARDTRLDRIVAVKVLSPHVTLDPQSGERFEREARAAAALSHPHICTLHDVGHLDGIDYLVMEYLEGETLAARLEKGPLRLPVAMRYATQIASALDRAHRAGIVHRDLKPGNVMLTTHGAKLLDFGLAKTYGRVGGAETVSHAHLTSPGIILGTLHYLAPEQIEGKEADARTDIFAFGSLFFEMVTGRQAFEGGSQAAVVAAILEHAPAPLSQLLPETPPFLDHILGRCFAKEPDDRWQSARDLTLELESLQGDAPLVGSPRTSVPGRRREWLGWIASAALLLFVIAMFIFRAPAEQPHATHVTRLSVPPPEHTTFIGGYAAPYLALSPDGQHLAFVPTPIGGRTLLWIRDLDSLTARALAGTDGATFPFWSPDGRRLAFFADGKLKTVESGGGVSQVICDAPDGRGGTWSRENAIVFAPQLDGPLYRVPAAGGQPSAITALDVSRQEASHRLPAFLPDGRHFLFLVQSGRPENSAVVLGSMESGEIRRLNIQGSKAIYAAGFLIFGRERSLMAQRFDLSRLELVGEPAALGDQVTFRSGVYGDAPFSLADNGTLVYWNGGPFVTSLMWSDRQGNSMSTLGKPGGFLSLDLSSDDKKVAVEFADPETQTGDIWLIDATSGIRSRLTVDPAWDFGPSWSPDGTQVLFGSIRNGRQSIYRATTTDAGSDQVVLTSADALGVSDWSSNGHAIVVQNMTKFKVGVVDDAFNESTPSRVLESKFAEADGRVSPDGRWLAYTSNESGSWDVYVRPFPALNQKWRISPEGGSRAMWRPDGKELFYVTPDQTLMAVSVKTDFQFTASAPVPLFQLRMMPVPPTQPRRQYAVSAKGDRFLVNTVVDPPTPTPLTVVLDWIATLKK